MHVVIKVYMKHIKPYRTYMIFQFTRDVNLSNVSIDSNFSKFNLCPHFKKKIKIRRVSGQGSFYFLLGGNILKTRRVLINFQKMDLIE